MFEVSFKVEDKHLGELFAILATKIKVYDVDHKFIRNVTVKDESLKIDNDTSKDVVIEYLKTLFDGDDKTLFTPTDIGNVLKENGFSSTSKSSLISELEKQGIIERVDRGIYAPCEIEILIESETINEDENVTEKENKGTKAI